MSSVADLISRLRDIDNADMSPFPYPDCRRLAALDPRYRDLIPDLDAYLGEFAGYRSRDAKIRDWTTEKLRTVAHRLGAEETRVVLLELTRALLNDRGES